MGFYEKKLSTMYSRTKDRHITADVHLGKNNLHSLTQSTHLFADCFQLEVKKIRNLAGGFVAKLTDDMSNLLEIQNLDSPTV